MTRRGVALLLVLCAAVGFWLRARHLGALGLVVDEGNQALAVQGILEHGLPRLETGQLYTRALPFLYLQAASAAVFGLNEFSLRLPSALFGVGAILMAFVLARTVLGLRVAVLTALLMTCSVWEIEMSRYARFYTAFQFMYLTALWCFYRGFLLDGAWRFRIGFFAAAAGAILLHELGVMLAACFLLALFSNAFTPVRKAAHLLGAGAVFAMWKLYPLLPDVLKAFVDPVAYAAPSAPSVDVPRVLLSIKKVVNGLVALPNVDFVRELAQQHPAQFAGLAGLAVFATAYVAWRGLRRGEGWTTLLAVPVVWAAFLHQFGLALLLLVGYLALTARGANDLVTPALKVVYGAAAACLVFWIQHLARHPVYHVDVDYVLLSYPHLSQYVLSWFIKGWPVMSVVLLIGCARLIVRFLPQRTAVAPMFLLGALWLPAALASFQYTPFYAARYAFHLYPLAVIIVALAAVEAGAWCLRALGARTAVMRAVAVAGMTVVALVVSQDADPSRAVAVGSRSYRSPQDPIRGLVNWTFYNDFHQDYKSPSHYVRERLGNGDRVVVLGPPYMAAIYHYYTGGVDYAVQEAIREYQVRLKDGRVIDRMTASKVIPSVDQLRALVERGPEGLWLLADRRLLVPENHEYSDDMKAYLRVLARKPDYVGLDGETFAVKIR